MYLGYHMIEAHKLLWYFNNTLDDSFTVSGFITEKIERFKNKRKVFMSWKNIFRRKEYISECLNMPAKLIKDVKMSMKISNRTTDRFIRRHAFKLVYVICCIQYAYNIICSIITHHINGWKSNAFLQLDFWNLSKSKSPKRLKKMYEKNDVSSEAETKSCPGSYFFNEKIVM